MVTYHNLQINSIDVQFSFQLRVPKLKWFTEKIQFTYIHPCVHTYEYIHSFLHWLNLELALEVCLNHARKHLFLLFSVWKKEYSCMIGLNLISGHCHGSRQQQWWDNMGIMEIGSAWRHKRKHFLNHLRVLMFHISSSMLWAASQSPHQQGGSRP